MPRLVHAVPKYQKHRASGQAVVTINGRDYYLGPHGTKASKVEYDRLITEWLSSGRSSSFGAPEAGHHRRRAAGRLPEARRQLLRQEASAASTPRSSAPSGRLRSCTAARPPRSSASPSSRPSGSTSRRPAAAAATSTRSWAGSSGSLSGPPPRGRFRRACPRTWPSSPACGRASATSTSPIPSSPWTTRSWTPPSRTSPRSSPTWCGSSAPPGMRPAEVCILRPCDLDRSGEVWFYRPSHHKTEHHGKERIVPIGPKGQEVLLRYLARGPEDYCFRPDRQRVQAASRPARRPQDAPLVR